MEISIQSKWTSPDGKIVVVTTPEQEKYHCYKLPLFQHLAIGEIEAEVKEYVRPAKGQYPAKNIKEIVNIKVNGLWFLKEQTEEPTPGVPQAPKKPVKEQQSPLHQESSEMTKADWAGKERITRKSIERQKALDIAKDIAVARINQGKEFKYSDILGAAKIFESYLESGVIIEEKKPVETKSKVT